MYSLWKQRHIFAILQYRVTKILISLRESVYPKVPAKTDKTTNNTTRNYLRKTDKTTNNTIYNTF